jgi:hypothetical protein
MLLLREYWRRLVFKGREFSGNIASSREKVEIWLCSVFCQMIFKFDLFVYKYVNYGVVPFKMSK